MLFVSTTQTKGKCPTVALRWSSEFHQKKYKKKFGKRFVSAAVAARRPDQQMKVKTFAVCFTASVFGPLNRLVSFEDERADRESGWRACSTPPQIPNLSDGEMEGWLNLNELWHQL